MYELYSFSERAIDNPHFDESKDLIRIGNNNNYFYDIICNKDIISKLRKSYVSDLIFNIEIKQYFGYSYKITFTESVYSKYMNYIIYCDTDTIINRINNNEINDFENYFYRFLFQKNPVTHLIDVKWKENSTPNTNLSKQPKKLNIKLFKYHIDVSG